MANVPQILLDPRPRRAVLPEFISTQMLAGVVYTAFIRRTAGEECLVWIKMMEQELKHAQYLQKLLSAAPEENIRLPAARMEAFQESVQRALDYMNLSAMERVQLALRVEHAELDYGFEGLLLGNNDSMPSPHYDGSVREHYEVLLGYAQRYAAAEEIATQITRLTDHFPELK